MISCASRDPLSNIGSMVLNTTEFEKENFLRNKIYKKKFYCKNMKRKKQTPFPGPDVFRFSDYDCIGFDLDNTICRYKVGEIMRLEYRLIAEYMVDKYGYDQALLVCVDEDMDFIQKGVIMDIKKGNFLKCSRDGVILRATHGTQPMTRAQIIKTYGCEKIWQPVIDFRGFSVRQLTCVPRDSPVL